LWHVAQYTGDDRGCRLRAARGRLSRCRLDPRLLEQLLAAMGARPGEILRGKGTPAAELGLLDEGVDDATILDAMVTHPILVNRPIVATPKGTRLCRPSEQVLDLLERAPDAFVKEDGEIVRR
jgi:arsenate reductase (glutaredoxin)